MVPIDALQSDPVTQTVDEARKREAEKRKIEEVKEAEKEFYRIKTEVDGFLERLTGVYEGGLSLHNPLSGKTRESHWEGFQLASFIIKRGDQEETYLQPAIRVSENDDRKSLTITTDGAAHEMTGIDLASAPHEVRTVSLPDIVGRRWPLIKGIDNGRIGMIIYSSVKCKS